MHRSSSAQTARVQTTDDLWRLLVSNLEVLADDANHRHCPPERRQRTRFALEAAKELRHRGTQGALLPKSEGRATRNAIFGDERR